MIDSTFSLSLRRRVARTGGAAEEAAAGRHLMGLNCGSGKGAVLFLQRRWNERARASEGLKWQKVENSTKRASAAAAARTDHRIRKSARPLLLALVSLRRRAGADRPREGRRGASQNCRCSSVSSRSSKESAKETQRAAKTITPRRRRRIRPRRSAALQTRPRPPRRRRRQIEVLPLIAFLWERKLHVSSRCYTAPFMLE